MSVLSPARIVAFEMVSERRRRGAHMRDLLRTSRAMSGLAPRDRALASRLTLGVTATVGSLDTMIDSHLRHGVHIEPRVRDALRVSCYELCWLDTPTAVVISQGVELVRRVVPRAAGLANAVLHRVSEHDIAAVCEAEHRIYEGSSDLLAKDIAIACGMPEPLVYQLLASCGEEVCRECALAHLQPAPVYIATNLAMLSLEEAMRRMQQARLEVQPLAIPGSWQVTNPARLAPSGLVRNALVFPVDLAAQMVARIAGPLPGQHVLEVGQGRGTKTLLLQMAALEQGGLAEIVSIDSEDYKVRLASSRMAVAGVSAHTQNLCFDASQLDSPQLPTALSGGFDMVFIDAPCSGTGTLRRHPEIVWGLSRASVMAHRADSLPALQLRMLRAASQRVRPGGSLAYATCSLLEQENTGVVRAFLESSEGRSFEQVSVLEAPAVRSLSDAAYGLVASCVTSEGYFASHPRITSFDGHFCALLRRV
ncbi:RsmB/NOP family class I SAM-dependent RNA methyltransferase [Olegusella massiliensis]|uniref:RsmB/NOP family class I SAM-dependent RNA methyltransferase n=1 Tax=Olegusella massiliensis TaxID=1776381 RepID=UPI0009ECFF81|nr:transcription antitermination factor NusB [Olegusella massiliensis]